MRGLGSGTVRNYFPAYRVFIFGVEVTSLCTSVRTSWPTHSPMQCTIELVNPDNLMTITFEDAMMIGQLRERKNQQIYEIYKRELEAWQVTQVRLAESTQSGMSWSAVEKVAGTMWGLFGERASAQKTLEDVISDWTNLTFNSPTPVPPVSAELAAIKNTIIPRKIDKGKYLMSVKGPDGEKLPPEVFFKYPFYQGKWIWHFSDPVSVAFRDPSDPSLWYWMHRGTVTDVAEKETEDKQSVLTITSEGALKALRSARIMNATGAILTPEIEGMSDDEFFTLLTSVPYSNFLQRLTLRNILELMIFGSQSLIDDLNERVHNGITFAELEERFGVIREQAKRTDRVTEKDVKFYADQLRNLNTTGLKFKQWRGNQGVETRIVGGPVDPTDEAIGEAVTLSNWQRLVDNRVRLSDLGTMYRQNLNLAQGADAEGKAQSVITANVREITRANEAIKSGKSIDDVITEICSDPDNYPMNQRVRLLMPAHLGSRLKNNVVDQELSSNIASSAEFFDRLSLLQQTLDRIEFVLYDSPRGDIVVEMPLYDFEPYHFSQAGESALDAAFDEPATGIEGWKRVGSFLYKIGAGLFQEHEEPPLYESREAYYDQLTNESDQRYELDFAIFPFEQISIDIASSEQDVKTAFIARPRVLAAQADDQSKTAKKGEVAVLPNLIPLYGLRVEQGDTYGAITSPEAARVFAQIMLNRTNADTVNLRVPCLPNWAAWPNRPIWIQSRNIISTTKSIAHTIAWQSDANTDYGLWHSKFWDGRMTKDRAKPIPLYVTFGGVNARPFNYAYLLGIRDRNEDANNEQKGLAEALLSIYIRSGRR